MSTPVLFVSKTSDGSPFGSPESLQSLHMVFDGDSPRLRIVDVWLVIRTNGETNHQVVVGTGTPDPEDASVGSVAGFDLTDEPNDEGELLRTNYIDTATFEIGAGDSLWVNRLFGAEADVYVLAYLT